MHSEMTDLRSPYALIGGRYLRTVLDGFASFLLVQSPNASHVFKDGGFGAHWCEECGPIRRDEDVLREVIAEVEEKRSAGAKTLDIGRT